MSPGRTHKLNGPPVVGTPALITCLSMRGPPRGQLRSIDARTAIAALRVRYRHAHLAQVDQARRYHQRLRPAGDRARDRWTDDLDGASESRYRRRIGRSG